MFKMIHQTIDAMVGKLQDPLFSDSLARNVRDSIANSEDVVAAFYAKFLHAVNDKNSPQNEAILEALLSENSLLSGQFFDEGKSYLCIYSLLDESSVHSEINRRAMIVREKLLGVNPLNVSGTASFIAKSPMVSEVKAHADMLALESNKGKTHYHDYQ